MLGVIIIQSTMDQGRDADDFVFQLALVFGFVLQNNYQYSSFPYPFLSKLVKYDKGLT